MTGKMKTRNQLQLLWNTRQSPSENHFCDRPVSNIPQCMDCSSQGEHQINIKKQYRSLFALVQRRREDRIRTATNLAAEAGQHTPKFGASLPCVLASAPALGTQGLGAPRRGPGREQTGGGWGCRPRRSILEEGRLLLWLPPAPQHQVLNIPLP